MQEGKGAYDMSAVMSIDPVSVPGHLGSKRRGTHISVALVFGLCGSKMFTRYSSSDNSP